MFLELKSLLIFHVLQQPQTVFIQMVFFTFFKLPWERKEVLEKKKKEQQVSPKVSCISLELQGLLNSDRALEKRKKEEGKYAYKVRASLPPL